MTESFKDCGPGWNDRHLDAYLKTSGKIGHLVDFTPDGGAETPCLILQTTGRESGKPRNLALIYGKDGQNFVIVATEDGAAEQPDWLLDLAANPAIKFQVLDAKYSGKAEIAPPAERQRLFDMMAKIHRPYVAYQEQAGREIPVVILHPEASIDRL
jgi:deazaflavin-dependent oxidoreductase (nitroreductase family)